MHGALWVSFHSGESISASCGWANVGHAAPVTAFGIWPKCCALKFSRPGSLQSLSHFLQRFSPKRLQDKKKSHWKHGKQTEGWLFFGIFPCNWYRNLASAQHKMALKIFFLSFHKELYKRICRTAEQTLLSKTTDRCPLSCIGLDAAACHLSHLNGPRGDPSVASELYTLLALTQSNARSALGGSHWWQPLRCPHARRGPTPVTSSTWTVTLIYTQVTPATTAFT